MFSSAVCASVTFKRGISRGAARSAWRRSGVILPQPFDSRLRSVWFRAVGKRLKDADFSSTLVAGRAGARQPTHAAGAFVTRPYPHNATSSSSVTEIFFDTILVAQILSEQQEP